MLSPVIFLSACPLQTSVEGDMSLASKLSHGSLNNSNHQNNKNSNNNHNSKQGSPVRGDSRQAEDVEGEKPEIMLEESRKVVEAFLKRSMSQNAKASFDFMKPEGTKFYVSFNSDQKFCLVTSKVLCSDLPNKHWH